MILEKIHTDDQLQEMGTEFYVSLLSGTLTEQRYDEIVEVASWQGINEGFLEMIMQGEPQWRQKHLLRYAKRIES
jgi:hypothetical protein